MSATEAGHLARPEGFREWLCTNEIGSFAMGTPRRLPERKYHGLLTVRAPVFADPHQVLAEVNEVLFLPEGAVELASFHYGETIHPSGFQHLEHFEPGPEPKWVYAIGGTKIIRSLRLHPHRNTVALEYEIEGAPAKTQLLLYPYFNCRGIHDLQKENAILDGRRQGTADRVVFEFYKGFPKIFLDCRKGSFELSGFWNQRVTYPEEKRRGYDAQEDLFCPGAFRVELQRKTQFKLVVGLEEEGAGSPAWPKSRPLTENKYTKMHIRERLAQAANAFLIRQEKDRASVIAGYPWFGEWGRDTFISLAGLTLARGEHALAGRILSTYAGQLKKGLVPNVLGRNAGESDGYAIDASLWFIRALQQYEAAAGSDAVRPLVPVVFELLETMLQRKVRGIHVRPSGLLYASAHPRPLTWMDARVDGLPVTPRSPFAVDVNALFYNAICFALAWANRLKRPSFVAIWTPLRDKLAETFREAFWLEDANYLADAHDGLEPDSAFRPNQLLALALPNPLLTKKEGALVLSAIREKLLTPFGLRTLAPQSPAYRGICFGDAGARDAAYHQGTVWPWLLGIYWDAIRYVKGKGAAKKEAKILLEPFKAHLQQACLGQISEIFDGDPPHTPRGAPAQAWSVAELLRIAVGWSDLDGADEPASKA